jgi:hypothetical protein
MRFAIEPRTGYLRAELWQREPVEEMRRVLTAVHAACQEHARTKEVIVVRRSRPAFKPEDYGLTGCVTELVTDA